MAVDPLAVAIYGFVARPRVTDDAGHAYEAYRLLDRLTLGLDCTPIISEQFVYKYRGVSPDGTSLSDLPNGGAGDEDDVEEEDVFDKENESYKKYLMSLDPVDTKNQDHYKVLGLKNLRYAATEAHIRKAYRAKVLHHHPDKRKGRGEVVAANASEDYFTCITKAFEQLGDTTKRRAYDSIDPKFDNTVPTQANLTADNFFEVLTPVFDRNARWSINEPVPSLGTSDDDEHHVENFYSFWFEFSSWREFSYLDEEDKEKGENRDERRWIDKQNKAQRQERRKDELKRIRNLVELAYANDPRVAKLKADQKRHKEERKQAKKAEQQAKKDKEDQERLEAEQAERAKQEAEELAGKQRAEEEKKKKDALKKRLKVQRKKLLDFLESQSYFATEASEKLSRAESVQKLVLTFDVDEMQSLNERLSKASNGETPESILVEALRRVEDTLEQRSAELTNQTKTSSTTNSGGDSCRWTDDEQQLLVKASTLFPVGTKSRWEVIGQFINDHRAPDTGSKPKTGRDIINRVKLMQQSQNFSPATAPPVVSTNGELPSQLQKSKKDGAVRITAEPSQADELTNGESKPWSSEEQRVFEQALRTHNAQVVDRWDRIADNLPGRTKKDCIRRYKELAELVKAKRAAQQKVAGK